MPRKRVRSSRAKHPNDPRGRRTVMHKPKLKRLEAAYKQGCNDIEAARKAKLAPRTLYYYLADHPEFKELCSQWRKIGSEVRQRQWEEKMKKWDEEFDKKYRSRYNLVLRQPPAAELRTFDQKVLE